MGVEWGKIGQNNSHALRNVGSFPQELYRASGLSPLRLPMESIHGYGMSQRRAMPENFGVRTLVQTSYTSTSSMYDAASTLHANAFRTFRSKAIAPFIPTRTSFPH
jgi:hypothetical protein